MSKDIRGTRKNSLQFWGIDKILIILFALYTFRGAWLAFDHGGYLPWLELLSIMIIFLCVPVGIVFCFDNINTELSNVALLILPLYYWVLSSLHTYGGYSNSGVLAFSTCALFILFPDDTKKRVFGLFYRMFLVMAVVSIFVWVCYFLKVDIGFKQELYYSQPKDGGKLYYYRWFIFAIYNSFKSYRLCGVFNEPGALGTLCALLFICTYEKSTIFEKIILLMTGVLSFSMAFFFLIFMYVTIRICLKRPSNIIFIALFAVVFLTIPNIDFHNENLNNTAARFKLTDTGLAGNNRTTAAFDNEYKEFLKSDDVWLGKGVGYPMENGNSSWKSHYMIPFGIVGTVGLLGMWIGAALHYGNGKRDSLIYIVLFMASLYQRPAAIEGILGYVLLLGGLIWMDSDMPLA